jgi:ethanolamine transporter
MDKKGLVLNSAFGATGAFVFGGHLAFTMIYDTEFALPMIVGKLVAGICAILLALAVYKEEDADTP